MMLSKKTWCFIPGCDGELDRTTAELKVAWFDTCTKCGSYKTTIISTGYIEYHKSLKELNE